MGLSLHADTDRGSRGGGSRGYSQSRSLLAALATLQACSGPPAPTGAVRTGSVVLSWNMPTERTDGTPLDNLEGYKVYYGPSASSLTSTITVQGAGTTRCEIENLSPGTYYFAVTAFDANGLESEYSNIASKVIH